MSQEVSKRLVSGLQTLLHRINKWAITHLPTIDPNFLAGTSKRNLSERFAWDMEGPVKHLSLAQLKGKSEKLKDLVEQVGLLQAPKY